jgi:hypothetical protein
MVMHTKGLTIEGGRRQEAGGRRQEAGGTVGAIHLEYSK